MQVPVEVVLRNVTHEDAVRADVREAVGALERFHDRITGCRVSVSRVASRHRTGSPYDVRVVLRVPGHDDIAVNRLAGDQPEREHLAVSLRKAFAQARRRLQDTVREMRGDVKMPAGQPMGQVTRIFRREGYGILQDDAGREVYFHRNAVADGKFAVLEVGSPVRFVEALGEKGPQASTVVLLATKRAVRASRTAPRR